MWSHFLYSILQIYDVRQQILFLDIQNVFIKDTFIILANNLFPIEIGDSSHIKDGQAFVSIITKN